MELESKLAIDPRHKLCPIKLDQPLIAWIKFITPSSSFRPSLECPALESAQISWISTSSASLIFLDLALVIGPTGTCNGSLNACWFSSRYFANSDQLDSWTHLPIPSNDSSQWTHREAYKCKGCQNQTFNDNV